MTEEEKTGDASPIDSPETPDEIRHYTASSSAFKLDWNMLLYSVKQDDGFELDWNKLIYNEEQQNEFHLDKLERRVRSDFVGSFLKPPCERTAMEIFFLKEAGFTVEEEENVAAEADYASVPTN